MTEKARSEYPEHDKLAAVKDQSQVIGEFLDFGLPQMRIHLSERITRPCECNHCARGQGQFSGWHTAEEKATIIDGRVQITDDAPTHRTIESLLAEWFDIDQAKIEQERRQMLGALREAYTARDAGS